MVELLEFLQFWRILYEGLLPISLDPWYTYFLSVIKIQILFIWTYRQFSIFHFRPTTVDSDRCFTTHHVDCHHIVLCFVRAVRPLWGILSLTLCRHDQPLKADLSDAEIYCKFGTIGYLWEFWIPFAAICVKAREQNASHLDFHPEWPFLILKALTIKVKFFLPQNKDLKS